MAASLVTLPSRSDAFQNYKPSAKANRDILTASSQASSAKGQAVNVSLPHSAPAPSTADRLQRLETVIAPILAGKASPVPYHQIVDDCRLVALDPTCDIRGLSDLIRSEMRKRAESMAREGRAHILSRQGMWLQRLMQLWDVFEERVNLISSLFGYVDRSYTSRSNEETILHEKKWFFMREVWNDPVLYSKTVDDIIAWATSERLDASKDVDGRTAVKNISQLAATLASEDYFQPYSRHTKEHYQQKASDMADELMSETLTGTEYVKWAIEKEEEEKERALACFIPTACLHPVHKIVDTVRLCVGSHSADLVVSKALDEAMYRADPEALSRLYLYCVHTGSFKTLVKSMQDHIVSRITTIISDPANDPQMIESTLKLKRFVDTTVASLFSTPTKTIQATTEADASAHDQEHLSEAERGRQLDLEDAVRSGFKFGLRSRQNAPAEWIAKHLDVTMRKGQGSTSEAEFNGLLDEIIALIGFTPDKDVFRAFYSTGLAKRLLLNKSASDDMERNMIVKLQKEMGDEFTSGDTMMKDLQLSETLVKSYQSARAKNPSEFKDHSDFTANVLTEAAWPPYPLLKDGWDFKLTPQLQNSIDTFTEWYSTQHKNRKLSWRHQLASATLTARFDSGKYEIGVSLFQTVVLLQFNDVDVLSFEELKSRTGIESSELVRTLQSLALGRKGTRVLVKRPAGKEVEPSDKFAINKAFTSDRIKFKINQIQQDLSVEESRKTNEQVALDRVSVLEATIVRIMKGKKKLSLPLLIDAVVSDVAKRFPPDVKEIKKRVESLIEREFLQREDADRQMLQYLA